jgi:hypothetical protein
MHSVICQFTYGLTVVKICFPILNLRLNKHVQCLN